MLIEKREQQATNRVQRFKGSRFKVEEQGLDYGLRNLDLM